MINKNFTTILGELAQVLDTINEEQISNFCKSLLGANKIIAVGAGRVGMATRGFVMRLGHLGLEAYMLGDTTVPSMGEGDLLLACSGSGETQSVFDIVEIAKRNGAQIALITGNPESRMGNLADVIVELKAPSKTKAVDGLTSIQPMTTLNEQSLGILLDVVVLELMDRLGETHDTMWSRHSNLE